MPRLATLLAALTLAIAPASAFAQGAGDDQYQDPFGDEPAQNDGGGSSGGGGSGSQDGGLSDEPPVSGGGSAGSGGSTGGGTTTTPSTPATAAESAGELPRTGTDPRILLLIGAGLVLSGVGLRLRTIDPDAF